jgi:hypothetical protein
MDMAAAAALDAAVIASPVRRMASWAGLREVHRAPSFITFAYTL